MATLNDLNIFSAVPSYYEGLLGAQETEALRNRANTQGLLGAAIGLLGGMGTRGTTASQNIAAALGGGLQSSQGAVQQGITNYSQAQQLAQTRLAQEQARIGYEQAALLRADVAKVMQMPEVASNPALVALLRSDPAKGLTWINENMAVSQAYQPLPQVAPQAPTAEVAPIATDGMKQLAPVTVTGKVSPTQLEVDRLLTANQRLAGLAGETARKAIESNLKQIDALKKQQMEESVQSFDFSAIRNAVNPSLLPQVDSLQRLADTGRITAKDLQDGLKDIQKADFDFKNSQRDYNKEAVRVAGSMFPKVPINELNSQQLGQLQAKLDELEIAKRRAGATTINMPSESERTAGYLATRFQNSLRQYNEVLGKNPEAAVPNLQAEVIRSVTKSNYLTNLATPEARQRMVAAELDMLSAALTLSTGAAYTAIELENQRQSLFPQLGDKPETIKDKAVRLNQLLNEAAMVKAGRAAPRAIINNDINQTIKDAVQQELERRGVK